MPRPLTLDRICPGSFEENFKRLNRFLRFHGYGGLRRQRRNALRRFQEQHSVPVTGNLNYQTCRLLNSRRCCHPELATPYSAELKRFDNSAYRPVRAAFDTENMVAPEIHIDPSLIGQYHPYQLIPARWARRSLRYAFLGAAPHQLGNAAWDAIRQAFSTWSATGVVSLSEVEDGAQAEIRVLWTPGPGGDPNSSDPFYGPGGYAAMSYYPYRFLGELAGDLHFDLAEAWSVGGGQDLLDIETVALHEVGHCLGIGHCSQPDSVMWQSYKEVQREPTDADIEELERKYALVPL